MLTTRTIPIEFRVPSVNEKQVKLHRMAGKQAGDAVVVNEHLTIAGSFKPCTPLCELVECLRKLRTWDCSRFPINLLVRGLDFDKGWYHSRLCVAIHMKSGIFAAILGNLGWLITAHEETKRRYRPRASPQTGELRA